MKNNEEVLSRYVSEVEDISETSQEKTITKGIPKKVLAEKLGTAQQDNDTKPGLGWQTLNLADLPTRGLYYPTDSKLYIRAAQGKEVKHWSTLDDSDLSSMDDMLNYILERCAKLSIPGQQYAGGSWKDIKDIDRFYILLAIRELTFPDAEDELKIPINEKVEIPVQKEMIDFINIPDEIMKYYSEEERCFILKFKNGKELRMYIPSLGINEWIKRYAINKNQARMGYDQDYLIYAPMLINDYRKLSERAYNERVVESEAWSAKEWTLISYVRDIIADAIDPKLKYVDPNDGRELTTPLNIQGGIKSLFRGVSDPLSLLD